MRVQVNMTEDDWLDAMARSKTRFAFSAKMLLIYAMLAGFTIWALVGLITSAADLVGVIVENVRIPIDEQAFEATHPAFSLLVEIFIGIVTILFFGLLWMLMFRDQSAIKKGVLVKSIRKDLNTGAAEFEIHEDAVSVSFPASAERYSWREIASVQKTSLSLVFVLKDKRFFGIPLRAFTSEAESAEALAAAQRYMAEARALPEETSAGQVAYTSSDKTLAEFHTRIAVKRYGVLYPVVWLFQSIFWQGALVAGLGVLIWLALKEAITYGDPGAALRGGIFLVILLVQPLTWRLLKAAVRMGPFGAKRGAFGEETVKTLEITPDGIVERSPASVSRIRWEVVENILETRSSLFFVLSEYAAIAAPKRAFADEGAFTAFVEKARFYKSAAQEAPPHPQASAVAG